jgi:ATP phosphoribosyltransferase regulatory subunit
MSAEGAIEFEALEAQAASLMNLFSSQGYERVAPAFIQPASLFLDRIGETLRARTYVFTDPNGEELCLRPDLTLPVCRVFVERGAPEGVAKFCYNGPAFRIQEGKPDPLRPREFRQAGVEYFGSSGRDADLEVLALTIQAVRESGVRSFIVRVGHLGLFKSVLGRLSMPVRWRERLMRAFWRHAAFARELATLSTPRSNGASLLPEAALTEGGFLNYLDANRIALVGLRRPAEIVQRLRDKAADESEPPLPPETVTLIERYLNVHAEAEQALDAIADLAAGAKLGIEGEIAEARSLFSGLKELAGTSPIIFEADFGRHFEYYTGMVFQIETGVGVAGQIGGGGRYDGLVRAVSRGVYNVPAVGAALHTERLLAAASRR